MKTNPLSTKLLVLALLCILSCTDEISVPNEQRVFKANILNYLDELSEQVDEGSREKIDDLQGSLDFSDISEVNVAANEKMLIVKVRDLTNFQTDGYTRALFFLIDGGIVRSNLIWFKNKHNNIDGLIKSLYTGKFNPKSYSGKYSVHNLTQDILFYNVIDSGNLTESGTLNRKGNGKYTGGRSDACIDWYLVTTYYYSNGTKRTEDQYLFTTCDSECQNTRRFTGRVTCGGGGYTAGNGSPAFPPNPINGDRYRFSRANGEKIDYIYNAPLGQWLIYLITTPEAVVESNPPPYPFLLTDGPEHNQKIISPEGRLYTFDAFSSNWLGENLIVPPSPDHPITDIIAYLRCLASASGGARITIYAAQPVPGSDDAYDYVWPNSAVVGHTFISIQQGSFVSVLGFYPNGDPTPVNTGAPSVLGNDQGEAFDVSVSVDASAGQLATILSFIKASPATYDLNTYNCTDFGIQIANMLGLGVPECNGTWPGGGGSNPGALGEFLRTMTLPAGATRNNSGGTAPTNNSGC